MAGTKAEAVIEIVCKIPESQRKKITDRTADADHPEHGWQHGGRRMAMIAKRCFPRATRVTDRFHVQQLATEALQEMRIKHR